MGTVLVILLANVMALGAALAFKMNVSEIYSFLAFNFSCLLFVGFINLVGYVKANVEEKKEELNDTTRTSSES